MDAVARETLARLLNRCRIGALGTMRDGGPFVSMTPVALAEDSSVFVVNVSRLAHHTQDMLKDARVSLMLMEGDSGEGDPQTLARLTICGEAIGNGERLTGLRSGTGRVSRKISRSGNHISDGGLRPLEDRAGSRTICCGARPHL